MTITFSGRATRWLHALNMFSRFNYYAKFYSIADPPYYPIIHSVMLRSLVENEMPIFVSRRLSRV